MNLFKFFERFIPGEFRKSAEREFRARFLVFTTAGLGAILWTGLTVVILLFPEFVNARKMLVTFDFLMGGLCFLGIWIFFKTRSFVVGSLPALLTLLGVVSVGGIENGGLKAPIVPIIFLVPLLAQFFTGDRRVRALLLGVCVAVLLSLRLLESAELTKPFVFIDGHRHSTVLLVVYILTCFISYGISAVYERSRQESENRISQLAKVASLDLVSGGFAHEVNSSLATIVLSADYLLQQANSESLNTENVKKVALRTQRAAAKISAVVKAIMASRSEKQNDEITENSARSIVENALFLCEESLKHNGIDVIFDGKLDSTILKCRPILLAQVLFSLIQNSQEALAQASEKWIKLSARRLGETVEFSISDSGSPIPREIAERLFTPFFSTKEVGQGYGLGLAKCATIISLQGGQMEYVATAPHTTFAFRVPLILDPPLPQSRNSLRD